LAGKIEETQREKRLARDIVASRRVEAWGLLPKPKNFSFFRASIILIIN
jgi:hypothetical protein